MASKIKSILSRLNRRDLPFFPNSKINKYFKGVFIVITILSSIIITKTILAAQVSPEAKEFVETQNAANKGNTNLETWTEASAISGGHVIVKGIGGTFNEKNFEVGSSAINWVPGGILGATTKSIAYLYEIPVSGIEYIAYVKDNFLGKPAIAAKKDGSMSPLINLWKGFRNVTYVLFSVVFVVIGIMIMLRIKISPQAVVTIQSTIPKLITSLILVTFSYAIVGLLIDLSYVIEGLGLSIVLKATNDSFSVIDIINNPSVWSRAFGLAGGVVGLFASISAIIVVALALAGPIGWGMAAFALVVIMIVALCLILVPVFKFFIGIIKCYITILLKTIIGPLEIAMGAIPNMKMGFGSWFMDIFANLMVFPISLIYLVLVQKMMVVIEASSRANDPLWTPPGLDILRGGSILAAIIGISGLMLLAKLPKLIPEFIFQIKPSPYGKALGESFTAFGSKVQKVGDKGFDAGVNITAQKTGKLGTALGNTWGGRLNKIANVLKDIRH